MSFAANVVKGAQAAGVRGFRVGFPVLRYYHPPVVAGAPPSDPSEVRREPGQNQPYNRQGYYRDAGVCIKCGRPADHGERWDCQAPLRKRPPFGNYGPRNLAAKRRDAARARRRRQG